MNIHSLIRCVSMVTVWKLFKMYERKGHCQAIVLNCMTS